MPIEQTNTDVKLLYETRSEEVQEIIGRLPNWILRWGITIIGLLLCAIFVGANYISYPDKLTASITINAAHPPVKIVAPSSAMIEKIMVAQNDTVLANQILLVLDSKSNIEEVQALKTTITQYIANNNLQNMPLKNLELGELQNGYNDLKSQINSLQYYLQHDASALKINQIQSQIAFNKNKTNKLGTNQTSIVQNSKIDKQLYETDKALYENGAITQNEFLSSKKKWLDQQVSKQANPNNIDDKQQQIAELQLSILNVNAEKQKEIFGYKTKLETTAKILLEQIRLWELKYIVSAPVAGKVNLFSIWQANQLVQQNQPILLITPLVQQTSARGFIPIAQAGEVKIGQRVLLDMVTHPQNKYGYVEAKINFISDVPMDSVYAVELQLNNGLQTTNHKLIPSLPVLYANAQIITKDISILERLFDQFKTIKNE